MASFRIMSIRMVMSRALAWPRLMMKLACTSDTQASPTQAFFRPSSSMSLPAGISSGFLKMQPALAPTGWESLRLALAAARSRSISSAGAGCASNTA